MSHKIQHYYYFIVNPYASNGLKASKNLNQLLEKTNLDYDVLETTEQSNIKDIISKLQPYLQEKDIIVSVGGDGTISEVVQAVNELNIDNPVGTIPAGSGRDFARAHDIPMDFEDAFYHLLDVQSPRELDVIITTTNENEKNYVVNSIGVGVDGKVIHNLHKDRGDSKIGQFDYLKDTLKSLFKQKPFDAEVTINGHKLNIYQTVTLLFMNQGYIGGGINVHPDTVPNDGYIDIVFFHNLNAFDLITVIPKLMFNQTHLSHPKTYTLKAKELEVTVRADEYWQADGETLGNEIKTFHMKTTKQLYWI